MQCSTLIEHILENLHYKVGYSTLLNLGDMINPNHALQILPILHYVPCIAQVMLLHSIHTLPSVTKVSATIVLQKLCNFACIFNIVK